MSIETKQSGADDGKHEYPSNNLLDVVEGHTKKRAELHELLADMGSLDLRSSDADTLLAVMNFRANTLACSWYSVLESLAGSSTYDSDEFISSVATLWTEDEIERAGIVNSIAPDANLIPASGGVVDDLKQGIVEAIEFIEEQSLDATSLEDVISGLQGAYSEYMQQDLQRYIDALRSMQYSKTSENGLKSTGRIKSFLPKLGKHALDTLKIAGGVSAGIVISSLLKKK